MKLKWKNNRSKTNELIEEIQRQKVTNELLKAENNELKNRIKKIEGEHTFRIRELISILEQSEIENVLLEKQKVIDHLESFHEILNSLNIAHNYLSDYISKEPKIEELNIVKSLLGNLVKVTSNHLEEEQICVGKSNFDNEEISDFSHIVFSILEIYKPILKRKHINLKSDIIENIFIKADSIAIEKITLNVLENAIKYTPDKGNVAVVLNVNNNKATLTIKDDGIGIPESDIEHIFKPFYRLNTKDKYKGFGLGLSLVKKIVDEIGGEITAECALNKGSEFNIVFDAYKLSKGEKVSEYKLSNDTIPDNFNDITDVIEGDRDALLIVEDNLNMQSYLRKGLKDNYNLYFAKEGKQALEKLKTLHPLPNMIISDIVMDRMDGIEFKTKLNSIKDYKHIPFIFLSAKASFKDKIKAMELGSVDYIFKPFKFKDLETKINSIITNNKAQKSAFIKAVGDNKSEEINFEKARSEKLAAKCKLFDLTKTEKQVIELLLLKKMKTIDIANKMYVSINTIRKHLTNIYRKMNVSGREGAEKLVFDIS